MFTRLRPTFIGLYRYLGFEVTREKKSINFYFIRVPFRKKVLKYGTPKRRKGLQCSANAFYLPWVVEDILSLSRLTRTQRG